MEHFSKATIQQAFNEILEEANNPPILLLDRRWYQIVAENSVKRGCAGMACTEEKIIWINKNQWNFIELQNTIWHEILHCLFPHCPEDWIATAAAKISCSVPSKDIPNDITVPSRKGLIRLIRHCANVMNGKEK